MVRFRSVLAFFDFTTSYCLISDNFLASHSIVIYMDILWGLGQKVRIRTENRVVIIYMDYATT